MFDQLFARSRLPQLVAAADGSTTLHANEAFKRTFGDDPTKSSIWSQLFPNHGSVLSNVSDDSPAGSEVELLCQDGTHRRFLVVTQTLEQDGQICLHATANEIESIARRNDLLRHAIAGTSDKMGDEYFRSVVTTLCDAFEMSVAIIARLLSCGQKAEMVAFLSNGEFLPPLIYDLDDTPCWDVYNGSRVQCVLGDLQAAYPNDLELVKLKVNSYLGIPILNENGKPIGHISLLDGNSIQKPAEHEKQILRIFAARTQAEFRRYDTFRELQQAKTTAESANHYKTHFLANISHEIRTPLTTVMSLTELLETDSGMNDHQLDSLRNISGNCNTLRALLNDMLEMSSIELGQVPLEETETRLSDIAAELNSTYQPMAKQNEVSLDIRLDESLPVAMYTDRQKLRRIVGNLTGNAIRHAGAGGTVLLSVSCLDDTQQQVEFRVIDDGEGIAKNRMSAIFEPFTTFSAKGAGLGLSIARTLAEHMQGQISVDSKQGIGSEFVLTLPMKAATPEPSANPEAAPAAKARNRVLVVDDNQMIRKVVCKLLERAKFQVQGVASGQEAVDICSNDMPPSLVLMDVRMPGMDGPTAAQKIRATLGESCPPIIGLTGDLLSAGNSSVRFDCFDEVLSKPFRNQELIDTAREFLE